MTSSLALLNPRQRICLRPILKPHHQVCSKRFRSKERQVKEPAHNSPILSHLTRSSRSVRTRSQSPVVAQRLRYRCDSVSSLGEDGNDFQSPFHCSPYRLCHHQKRDSFEGSYYPKLSKYGCESLSKASERPLPGHERSNNEQENEGNNNSKTLDLDFLKFAFGAVIVGAGGGSTCDEFKKSSNDKKQPKSIDGEHFLCKGIVLEKENCAPPKQAATHSENNSVPAGKNETIPSIQNCLTLNAKEQPIQKSDEVHSNENPSLELQEIQKCPSSDLKEVRNDEEEEEEEELSSQEDEEKIAIAQKTSKSRKKSNGNGKERIGFRDRKIIDYENRIRTYSTPDKIFRYFATYKSIHSDGEVYMTPSDFLRSITPGIKQPENLGLDQFRKYDHQHQDHIKLDEHLSENSIFYHLGSNGLISFSDYIFLLTILSTSRRQFEIAFRMFDLNGDGDVDAEEFDKVQDIIRQTTSNGKKHRDHASTGNTIKKMNSALANYFFGKDRQGKLTIQRFLDFQAQLQNEILALEFERKRPNETGRISEHQLADLLLTYANYSSKKRSAVMKRVKKKYKNSEEFQNPGISLKDYIMIFDVLMHIEDVDKALYFYHLAGASIDRSTLKHVAKVCANVHLDDHVIDVLFTIFDEDGDGGLSNKEFVNVMKNKLKRGLEKPKDTGLFNFFAAITKCAISTPSMK